MQSTMQPSHAGEKELPILWLSIDVETNGVAPGLNSMLSIGLYAIDEVGQEVFYYGANLEELPGTQDHEETMAWWNRPEQAEAWKECRRDPQSAPKIMAEIAENIHRLKAKYQIRTICWPAAFDWPWINYYFWRFYGSNPLGHTALDIGSYAMGALGCKYPKEASKLLEKYKGRALSHSALDDARVQGLAFWKLWREKHP